MGGPAPIGIAIPGELLEEFDRLVERRGYSSRSEVVSDLVRKELRRNCMANAEVHGP